MSEVKQQSKKKHIKKQPKQQVQQTPSQHKKPSQEAARDSKSTTNNTTIVGKPWSEIQVELRQEIVTSLMRNNYSSMFPVQQAAIPLLLKNYDLAVEAQTGSGKTLSFLVPLLQKYLALSQPFKSAENEENPNDMKIKYLLISPTRQLCQQSYNVLLKLLNKLPDQERSKQAQKYCYCATGGSELEVDSAKIKEGICVLVGTVGRIRQLSQQFEPDWLKKVDYLFIDQADRVLKEKGIEQVIKSIQKLRRTAMFSATLQGMQQKNFDFFGMRNLAKITLKAIDTASSKNQKSVEGAKGYVIPKSLTNTYLVMKDRVEKMHFLINFIQEKMSSSKIIVFLSTCASVDYYTKMMNLYFQEKQEIHGIHGKLKTRKRQKIIQAFLQKEHGVLFATDVVSRGIDFEYVHYILQADPPEDPDNYIHRIGRTARVNRPGTAILLIEEHEQAFINYLEQKGVGVKRVEKDLFTSCPTGMTMISARLYELIATDRDNVQKAKKAFVSYIRAYKEHDLRYIFEFKNIDIGQIANSFFLFRIPRIKQILGKRINSFQQHEIDIEAIPWLDKNQALQFNAKQQHRQQQREQREKQAKPEKNIKNIKSQRKKVKRRNQEMQMSELNKLHKQILKDKKGKNRQTQSLSDESDDDTEQIQLKIAARNR